MPEGALPGGPVRLLEIDPDLGRHLPTTRAADAAAAVVVRVQRLGRGSWDAAREMPAAGVIVIDGLVAHDVVLAGSTAAELLGPGDFVHRSELETEHPFLSTTQRWTVLEPTRLALLDETFERALSVWPELGTALIARSGERIARLGALRATSHVGRVEDRLLALMWHLAGRFGRVGSGGVILPLSLRHRVLGDLVGASRSTVTLAIGSLERRSAVARRLEGGWVLLKALDEDPAPRVRRSREPRV